jgi:hypothetical protein
LYYEVYVILTVGVGGVVFSCDYFDYIFGWEDTFFGESDFLFVDYPFELDETFKWRLLIFSYNS